MPAKPHLRPLQLALSWIVSVLSVYVAAGLLPGVHIDGTGGAFLVAAAIAAINAVLPPLIAAPAPAVHPGVRLPLGSVRGRVRPEVDQRRFLAAIGVDSFGDASPGALVIAAVSLPSRCCPAPRTTTYSLRSIQRVARRQSRPHDKPGILFLEIDGLALPVLRARCATGAPDMARWLPRTATA